MNKYSIQVFYDARDDNGKSFRATAVFQTEAEDVGKAYLVAQSVFTNGQKLGSIMPGHHLRFP